MDIDKAMSQIADIERALAAKDARIKELETQFEWTKGQWQEVSVALTNAETRLSLADKLAEAARNLWETSDAAHYDEDLTAALAALDGKEERG